MKLIFCILLIVYVMSISISTRETATRLETIHEDLLRIETTAK